MTSRSVSFVRSSCLWGEQASRPIAWSTLQAQDAGREAVPHGFRVYPVREPTVPVAHCALTPKGRPVDRREACSTQGQLTTADSGLWGRQTWALPEVSGWLACGLAHGVQPAGSCCEPNGPGPLLALGWPGRVMGWQYDIGQSCCCGAELVYLGQPRAGR